MHRALRLFWNSPHALQGWLAGTAVKASCKELMHTVSNGLHLEYLLRGLPEGQGRVHTASPPMVPCGLVQPPAALPSRWHRAVLAGWALRVAPVWLLGLLLHLDMGVV